MSVYFLGLLAQLLVRMTHERQRRQNRVVVDRVSGLDRLLVGPVVVGLFFILLSMYSPLAELGKLSPLPKSNRRSGEIVLLS
jgi:hypothetical protein